MSASVDMPLREFLKHIFYRRTAGLTVDVELITVCRGYDTRTEVLLQGAVGDWEQILPAFIEKVKELKAQ